MNAIKPLSFLLAMSVSGLAVADVTLTVPSEIDLLVANGEKPSMTSHGLFATEKTLTLPDGENQIAFRIERDFDKGTDSIKVESEVIIAKFNQSNQQLHFVLPSYRNATEAQEKIQQPQSEWALMTQSDENVEVNQDTLIKKGMQIGRDYPQETLEYNRKGGAAAVAVSYYSTAPNAPQLSAPVSASTAEEMLHFWYSKADEQTKARFKAYVNGQ